MANQFMEPMQSVLAEVNAVDGIPLGKRLNRAQLTLLRDSLRDFAAAVGEGAHCLVVTGGLGFVDRTKKVATEDVVAEACMRHFKRYPDEPQPEPIHVVVDSRGGSLDSAYRTVLFLRRFTEDLRVYVPRRAKSAATLIGLGANEIVMSPFAELGPLDTQIKDPRNPSKDVSALDCYQSVDYVREFGLQTLPQALAVLLDETQARIPLQELIGTATEFALGGVHPMLDDVTALDFGAWGRTLKIGETYARTLQLKLDPNDDEQRADRIARRLVYGYPHHPFPIDIKEAKDIGLTVSLMDARRYEASRAIARACEDGRFVGFLGDAEDLLSKVDTKVQQGPPAERAENGTGALDRNRHADISDAAYDSIGSDVGRAGRPDVQEQGSQDSGADTERGVP